MKSAACMSQRNLMKSVDDFDLNDRRSSQNWAGLRRKGAGSMITDSSHSTSRRQTKDSLLFKQSRTLHSQKHCQQPDRSDWNVHTTRNNMTSNKSMANHYQQRNIHHGAMRNEEPVFNVPEQDYHKQAILFPSSEDARDVRPDQRGQQPYHTAGIDHPITPNRLLRNQNRQAQSLAVAEREKKDDIPLSKMTPAERLRSLERNKMPTNRFAVSPEITRPVNDTWGIPVVRTRSMDGMTNRNRSSKETSKEKKRNTFSINNAVQINSLRGRYDVPDKNGAERQAMASITSQHHNSSEKKAKSSARSKGRSPTNDKVMQSKGKTLFEHAKKMAHTPKDRKRLQAIQATILGNQGRNPQPSLRGGSRVLYRDGEQRDLPSSENADNGGIQIEDQNWETPIVEDSAVYPDEAAEQLRNSHNHDDEHDIDTSSKDTSEYTPVVKTVTNWGITEIVSDLSCSSAGLDKGSRVPKSEKEHLNTASEKLQQAFVDAKRKVYPGFVDDRGNAQNGGQKSLFDERSGTYSTESGVKDFFENQKSNVYHQMNGILPRFDAMTTANGLMHPPHIMPKADTPKAQHPATSETPNARYQTTPEHLKSDQAVSLQSRRPSYGNTAAANKLTVNKTRHRDAKSYENHQESKVADDKLKEKRTQSPSNERIYERSKSRRPKSPSNERIFERSKSRRSKGSSRLSTFSSRSRSKTPDGLKLGKRRVQVDSGVEVTGGNRKSSKSPVNYKHRVSKWSNSKEAEKPEVPFFANERRMRSRSLTPSRLRLPGTGKIGSNRREGDDPVRTRRAITPNPFLHRFRTPGKMLGDSRQYVDKAEDELRAIKQKRELEAKPNSIQVRREGSEPGMANSRTARNLLEKSEPWVRSGSPINDNRLRILGVADHHSVSVDTQSSYNHVREDKMEHMYKATKILSPQLKSKPSSPRWFGKEQQELPSRSAFEGVKSSTASLAAAGQSTGGRTQYSNGSSVFGTERPMIPVVTTGSVSGTGRRASSQNAILQHMGTFDSLMKAIENDKNKSPGAEFAVVELGDEREAIETHTILVNRDHLAEHLDSKGLPVVTEDRMMIHPSTPRQDPEWNQFDKNVTVRYPEPYMATSRTAHPEKGVHEEYQIPSSHRLPDPRDQRGEPDPRDQRGVPSQAPPPYRYRVPPRGYV